MPEMTKEQTEQVLMGRTSPESLLVEPGSAGQAATQENHETKDIKQSEQKTDTEIKDEDLVSRLMPKESDADSIARLKRDYSASSKEAMRLKKYSDSLLSLLREQSLDVHEEDGIPAGLTIGKGYSKDAKSIDIKFKDLSDEEKELFESEPQKAIDSILAKAKKALVRVAPTMEQPTKALSPERKAEAVNYVKELKELDGNSKHQSFETNLPHIERLLASPSVPKALKDMMAQAPEFTLELLSRYIDGERSALLALAKKQKKETTDTPPLGPSSSAQANASGEKNYSDVMGKAIAAVKV